jgi:hypothetical protein
MACVLGCPARDRRGEPFTLQSWYYARRVPSQEEKNEGKNPMNQRLRKGDAMVMCRDILEAYGHELKQSQRFSEDRGCSGLHTDMTEMERGERPQSQAGRGT